MVMDAPPRRWPRWLAQIVLGVGTATLAVAGVVAVGNVARDNILPNDRYRVAFADIECRAPDGMDRAKFLDEVRYIDRFSEQVNVLDPALADRLRATFAKHPRVARVDNVEILSQPRIRVELTFR